MLCLRFSLYHPKKRMKAVKCSEAKEWSIALHLTTHFFGFLLYTIPSNEETYNDNHRCRPCCFQLRYILLDEMHHHRLYPYKLTYLCCGIQNIRSGFLEITISLSTIRIKKYIKLQNVAMVIYPV